VSGRDLRDVKKMAGVEGIVYAGSHGFDIESPGKGEVEYRGGIEALPALDAAEQILLEEMAGMAGARIERKKFAIAVHFREVDEGAVARVEEAVDDALRTVGNLRKTGGKTPFAPCAPMGSASWCAMRSGRHWPTTPWRAPMKWGISCAN
jgi:trehalose 6-phosphate phosphatase